MRGLAVIGAFLAACSPATVTRIGPVVPARDKGCDIAVLAPGEEPARPYQDVGVVSLRNCQDYQAGPCRQWLAEAACSLGADVAYGPGDGSRDGRADHLGGPVTVQVKVAAFVAALPVGPDDPVLNATTGAKGCSTETPPDADEGDPDAVMCKE